MKVETTKSNIENEKWEEDNFHHSTSLELRVSISFKQIILISLYIQSNAILCPIFVPELDLWWASSSRIFNLQECSIEKSKSENFHAKSQSRSFTETFKLFSQQTSIKFLSRLIQISSSCYNVSIISMSANDGKSEEISRGQVKK